MRNRTFVLGLAVLLCIAGLGVDQRVRWRAALIFDKATGHLNEIGWSDLLWMLRPGSEIYLEKLVERRNPYEVIASPRRSKSDIDAGERLFDEHCASCHGEKGWGGEGGPSLHDRSFRHGRSDWALYQTIRFGIPGTVMVGRSLPRDDTWRLVSYLDATLAERAEGVAPNQFSLRAISIKPVSAAELRMTDDGSREWLTYSGSYAAHRHSGLRQINRENVARLRVEWQRQLPTTAERIETSPILRGSTLFVTEPPDVVRAIDAASGGILWTYRRALPAGVKLCCGPNNRGAALLGGRIFVGTLDGHLVALDANTGKVAWDVVVADPDAGYSITGAPLAIDDMIITGVAGGDFLARGFIDAYDAATGARRWRFYTIPGDDEPGSATWAGPRGGGSTWLTGSFDPESRLLYWGVGNPSPNFYRSAASGDELYSDSLIALDVDTGKLRWYFQFTPHDLHDWDSVQIPVLIDATVGSRARRLVAFANRNGFFYLLDRINGQLLVGTPFARQNWTDGLDENGRPRVRPEAAPTRAGSIVYPSTAGATNWWSPTYDPALQLLYVPTMERGGIFYSTPEVPVDDDGEALGGFATPISNEDLVVSIKALEVTTGSVRWQHAFPARRGHTATGGLLSTAGRIVFGGDGETVFALDEETGSELWQFNAGGWISAPPVSFEMNGRQYLVLAAGRSILAFALPPTNSLKSARR